MLQICYLCRYFGKLAMGLIMVLVFFVATTPVYAATTPDLGQADSFGILSSTYTNTLGGTTINGDLGYTTGPAVAPTVNGTTYSPPSSVYSTAGTDQGSALTNLNGQACTHTFPIGAVDLATDTTHGTLGIYAPGVYCTGAASAASVGAGGITLSGSGTYIFKVNGALTTVANSVVTLSGGASACDVFWAPTGATTLGANSTFAGTDIDDAGITIGSTITWTGRALSFGGTVSTTTDTITTPTCPAPTATPTPTPTATPTSSPTPTPTTTTSSSSSSTSGSVSAPAARVCPSVSYVTPIIVELSRVDSDSVFVSWGPYSGINTFVVEYGPENGKWLYSTNVTGFSTTINALPSNLPMWFRVAATDGCTLGEYGEARLVGGTGGANLSGDTLIPLLPNTGIGPSSLSSKVSEVINKHIHRIVIGGSILIPAIYIYMVKRVNLY